MRWKEVSLTCKNHDSTWKTFLGAFVPKSNMLKIGIVICIMLGEVVDGEEERGSRTGAHTFVSLRFACRVVMKIAYATSHGPPTGSSWLDGAAAKAGAGQTLPRNIKARPRCIAKPACTRRHRDVSAETICG